jgi:hypothetical protein
MSVKQQKHSVTRQMIYSIIPFVDIWAFYRIEKFRVLLGIMIGYAIVGFISGWFLPDVRIVDILIMVMPFITSPLVIRHYTIKWNNLDTIRRKGSFSSDDNF